MRAWTPTTSTCCSHSTDGRPSETSSPRWLRDLDRDPQEVAAAWLATLRRLYELGFVERRDTASVSYKAAASARADAAAMTDPTPHHIHRILIIANETAEGAILRRTISDRTRTSGAEILVVAPALNSRLRHWTSDCDAARDAAAARLNRCLEGLLGAGVEALGRVGDADPLQAIADALSWFAADELIVVTHPEGRSNWLARDLVGRAVRRFGLPTAHLVVDGAAEMEFVSSGR